MRTATWAAPSAEELRWLASAGSRLEVEEFEAGLQERHVDAELASTVEPAPRSRVLRIVTKQTYTFEPNPAGNVISLPLTDVISSVGYRTCVLQMRVHRVDSMPGSCEVGVGIVAAARDPSAPSVLLLGGAYIASLGVGSSTVAPVLLVAGSSSRMPASFLVMMEAAPNDPGVMSVTVGVDVVLRR